MDGLSEYLLGVCAAALICAVVTGLLGKKGSMGTGIKFVCGCFMLLTVLSPLTGLQLRGVNYMFTDVSAEADTLRESGENSARNQLTAIITEQTQAYILDKAEDLGASITVQVQCSVDELPVPSSVQISGTVSPYAKKRLTDIITEDLGIRKEELTWS